MKPSFEKCFKPSPLSDYQSKMIVTFFERDKFCSFSFLSSACFRNPPLEIKYFRKKTSSVLLRHSGFNGALVNYSDSSFKQKKGKIWNSLNNSF